MNNSFYKGVIRMLSSTYLLFLFLKSPIQYVKCETYVYSCVSIREPYIDKWNRVRLIIDYSDECRNNELHIFNFDSKNPGNIQQIACYLPEHNK